jgi:hypothetical protein
MLNILTEIQLRKRLLTPLGHPKAPLARVSKSAKGGRQFWRPLLLCSNLSLFAVQGTRTACKSVERRRIDRMLRHDPITVPDELLERRRPERPHPITLLAEKGVGFAEHEAYAGPERLSLMKSASYGARSLRIGRHIVGMSHRCKIVTTNDASIPEPVTHPMIEKAKDRERTRSSHKGTSNLRHIHLPIINDIVFSAISLFFDTHVNQAVSDIMQIITNSERTTEFRHKEPRKACSLKTVYDGGDRIMSETICCTSKVGRKPNLTIMSRPIQSSQDILFRMRSVRKDLRNLGEYRGPKDLSNQVPFGEQACRWNGNYPCLHPEFGDYGRHVHHPLSNRVSQEPTSCVGSRELCIFHRRREKCTSTQSSTQSTLETVGESGGFNWYYRFPEVPKTPENLRKGDALSLLDKTLYYRVVTPEDSPTLNRGGSRRRQGQRSIIMERASQQCVDMTLDILQQLRRSHVSTAKRLHMPGYGLSLNRHRSAWKSACKPAEGKLALYTESAIKPARESSGKRDVDADSPLLESSGTQLTADTFKGVCDEEPTVARDRSRKPSTEFPRTGTRSNSTRNQSAPHRFPHLCVLYRSPKTRDWSSRPPTTSYKDSWLRSALQR